MKRFPIIHFGKNGFVERGKGYRQATAYTMISPGAKEIAPPMTKKEAYSTVKEIGGQAVFHDNIETAIAAQRETKGEDLLKLLLKILTQSYEEICLFSEKKERGEDIDEATYNKISFLTTDAFSIVENVDQQMPELLKEAKNRDLIDRICNETDKMCKKVSLIGCLYGDGADCNNLPEGVYRSPCFPCSTRKMLKTLDK